eukprot:7687931-Alexandrium_andersonii.AAC.1
MRRRPSTAGPFPSADDVGIFGSWRIPWRELVGAARACDLWRSPACTPALCSAVRVAGWQAPPGGSLEVCDYTLGL